MRMNSFVSRLRGYCMRFLSRRKCDNCGIKDHLVPIQTEIDKEGLFLCEPCHADLRWTSTG
jgi:hypothetical protein